MSASNAKNPVWPTYSWKDRSPSTQLVYITDIYQADLEVVKLRGPLGFDLEWKPNFVKGRPENPVALVQLSDENTILLIQISAMAEFPSKLEELLEDPDIVKAGVGIQHDCKKLYADCKVTVRNCVDLSLLARCVDNARWKGRYTNPIGLSRLVETYEEHSLPKGRIQRSNWENPLSRVQQNYAANDAHSGFTIYQRFAQMAQAMTVAPKPVYYSFDAICGHLCDPSGGPWSPGNPDYDPGPLPPPRQPTSTETPGDPASSTGESVNVGRLALSGPNPDHRTLEFASNGEGEWKHHSSRTPPRFSRGRHRPETQSRASHHALSNQGRYRPEIPDRDSHPSSDPSAYDQNRHRLQIPNGRVSYNPPSRAQPDGCNTSRSEPKSTQWKKSQFRSRRRGGGSGGGVGDGDGAYRT